MRHLRLAGTIPRGTEALGDHGELFLCIHLNREWQFHAKSNELTDAFLACPPD